MHTGIMNTDKINEINIVLKDFFDNPSNPRCVLAKSLMPLFIKHKIFNSDHREGLPIRNLLRALDRENKLNLIPFVQAERKTKNIYWYFMAAKTPLPQQFSLNSSQHSRKNSDEYYVINLCNKILGLTASQQYRFDFLRGDSGVKLPVDAYYEELDLVIEYHEKQHSEKVPFFDNKNTVSGISRGVQRKIYDQRRLDILTQHGIKVVIISYLDFGVTKRIIRDTEKDTTIIKNILIKQLAK